jgi:hypothetical protein
MRYDVRDWGGTYAMLLNAWRAWAANARACWYGENGSNLSWVADKGGLMVESRQIISTVRVETSR